MSDSANSPAEAVSDQLSIRAPKYCRAVLKYFDSRSTDVATVEDLEEFIADTDTDYEETTRIGICLHHSTLPKLEERGIVDYDPRTNTLQYHGPTSVER